MKPENISPGDTNNAEKGDLNVSTDNVVCAPPSKETTSPVTNEQPAVVHISSSFMEFACCF